MGCQTWQRQIPKRNLHAFFKKASFILKNYLLSSEGQLAIENYPVYLFDIHKNPVTHTPMLFLCFPRLSQKIQEKKSFPN